MATRSASTYEGRPLLDIVSYARRGPGRDQLSRQQVECIARTAARVPEVMVKVSGGGTGVKAVAAHFKYIDRHGTLTIESDDGAQLTGKGVEKALLADWELELDELTARSPYSGRQCRKPRKLVHNVVLSMPAGTDANKLLAAARTFAREQFALKHRYAMVLHTDQKHPHVHLVIKAMGERGERLNIRKATLREWRQEFARHLRDHGVAANATERAVRGQCRGHKLDGIFRAARRGTSTHMESRIRSIATDIANGRALVDPGKGRLVGTGRAVHHGWAMVVDRLQEQGERLVAEAACEFLRQMPRPVSEAERIADQLRTRSRVEGGQRSTAASSASMELSQTK